ncbi:MAG: molybdopterin-dependent oxidoreductase [Deltaproteobacteria bacterium]|nr:molybdopterin-dependent oxidoreductase [Deltaproteobacteria bacterium]
MANQQSVSRVCPFCEATCGVTIEVADGAIVKVRGDRDDPFSRGFICPKAHALKELYDDSERLRRPLKRTPGGWQEISWPQAYREISARLLAIRKKCGPDAIGMYAGNPLVHDLAFLYLPVLARALGSRNVFNAGAIDTLPKEVQTGLMFGGPFPATVPVPDIDRTKYLLIVGANPAVSHGSLMTMPDAPGRLKNVIARGGRVVVIDPRRTETARLASKHHFIRPGTDAAFLLAMVRTLFEEGLIRLGAATGMVNGLDSLQQSVRDFTPEAVADYCGISAAHIRRMAREFAAGEQAACYGRLGTCVQKFGTLACWGVELMNILTGNLDRAGGVMFPRAAAPATALAGTRPFKLDRWKTRVSGQPRVGGMNPSSAMAEEMLTPGAGQVRAMILLMTNPLRSAAHSRELEAAFAGLECLVAVDFYLNETTRHADFILPTPSPAEQPNYEFGLYHLSVRTIAKWSWAAVSSDSPPAWEVMLKIGAGLLGLEGRATKEVDDMMFAQVAQTAVKRNRHWEGLSVEEVVSSLAESTGPERVIDMLLRLGPYGDGFGRNPSGLTLGRVKGAPHGIDLGPLQPRLGEIINTQSGKIELAPTLMVNDLPRLRDHISNPSAASQEMLLIGRRNLRTSNSFMHNLPALVKGRNPCTLQVSPHDAARLGIANGSAARVTSRVGSVIAPVEVTGDLMPGVVSLPHGWGHDVEETRLSVAKAHGGVNTNFLTDNQAYDTASGTAVLFGTPVSVEPAH